MFESNLTRSKLVAVPQSQDVPLLSARDDMKPRQNLETMEKSDIVKYHAKLMAYVGEKTESPWFRVMWATLLEDGKFLVHSGQDPLAADQLTEVINRTDVLMSENLWDLAGIVRDNNSTNCKLEAYLNFRDLFGGLGVRLIRAHEIQLDVR